jgi:hypothetical protein
MDYYKRLGRTRKESVLAIFRIEIKVKLTLEQAIKVQRWIRGIALLFL